MTLTASPTELTESPTAQDVTVTIALSAPAGGGTAFKLTFNCATCYADYSVSGQRLVSMPEGSTSATAALKFLVSDDLPVDGGKVIEVGAAISWYDVQTASITLREPVGPTIAVAVADTRRLSPAAACGGNAPCVLETAGQVRLSLAISHPPTRAYRQCSVALAWSGPNTAAMAAGGRFNDYQLSQTAGGVRLGPGAWSADVWLVPEYDGYAEGPEAVTLRGTCAGSVGDLQHYHLRWAATTIWIGDVPWPTLTVERPANGFVTATGIDCGSGERDDCAHAAPRNDSVALAATADPHHRFAGWGGACSGTDPCTVLLDADKAVSAAFAPTSHLLTVERASHGYVTGTSIDCGSGARADCEERHAPGATATLRATADANHRLLRWSGACSGTAHTCSVKMDAAKTAAAVFGPEQRWLWVSPPDGGRITGPDIDCGDGGAGDCVKTYGHGEEVVLTAVASANHELESWSGPCDGDAATCTATMDRNKTAGASFAPVRRTLTVERPANGHVSAKGVDCGSGTRDDCTESGPHGSSLVLRATADDGYGFKAWTGACATGKGAGGPKCALRLDGDLSAGATFGLLRTLTLTAPANGYVTGPGISCGAGDRADCTESYLDGTTVTLTPTGATGHDFEKWGGACLGADAACSLDMTADRAVTVRFEAQRRTLSVTVTGSGSVAGSERLSCSSGATCERDYPYGTTVTLTATAPTGHDFEKWGGACSGTAETCTVTMTANAIATAKFKPEKRTLRVTVTGTGTVKGLGDQECSGTCTWTYDYGTLVTLKAESGSGQELKRWKGECSDAGERCGVTLRENGETTAEFGPSSYQIAIKITGKGSVYGPGDGPLDGPGDTCTWEHGPVGTCTSEDEHSNCTWNVSGGGKVRLEANPAEGHEFVEWGGSGSCLSDPVSICVFSLQDVSKVCRTATFKPQKRTLSVTIAGTGSVTGTGDFSCSQNTCMQKYDYDTSVKLKAVEGTGQDFDKWTGACENQPETCTVTMTADRSTTAHFKPEKRTLTVTIVGDGSVTGEVAGKKDFTCSSGTCTKEYDYGKSVSLKEMEGSRHVFGGWSGACSGKSSCTVEMTVDRSVTATFNPKLSVTIVGTGTVTGTATDTPDFVCRSGTCTMVYEHGKSVTLEATEGLRHAFGGWTGACSGKSTCMVEMTTALSATATFIPKLSVTIVGTGKVTATATGTTDFVCSSGTCTMGYSQGKSVTLKAAEGTNHAFHEWTGPDCTGTSRSCMVKMDAPRSATANFKPLRTLSVTISGDGAVSGTGSFTCSSGTCSQKYKHGTEVTLTATVNLTHDLAWSGCDEADGRTCEVTMTSDKAVTLAYTLRCPADCTTSTCGSKEVCKCAGTSCPSNYVKHGNCAATAARTCTGDTDGCSRSVRDTRCTTGSRSALANRGPELCLYEHRDRRLFDCRHSQRTCRATITHVGCVLSLGGPVTPPIDFQDEEVWTNHAPGYILPNFECGAKANTCTVEFEDETVTTDDYGVVDKDDTDGEWRWECHSDNGTVRQCTLPKGDG